MDSYDLLCDLVSRVKHCANEDSDASFSNIRLSYHHNGSNADAFRPIEHIAHVVAGSAIGVHAAEPVELVFYVVRSEDALATLARTIGSHPHHTPSIVNGVPHLDIVRSQRMPEGPLSVLRFFTNAGGPCPYLYFLYQPASRESVIVLGENDRRANYLVTEILLDLLLAHSNLFGMHASAVSYQHRGIIFVGNAGAGKTSLTLAFVRAGAEFISDDISIISPKALLLPFEHKQLTLRLSTIKYLAEHGRATDLSPTPPEWHEDWRKAPETYRYMPDIFGPEIYGFPVPITTIIAPVFRTDTDDVFITPIPPSDALAGMQSSLLPWLMRWEDAFGISGRRAAVQVAATQLLTARRVHTARLERRGSRLSG
ncbi:MAG: hypothetical protein ACR2PL_19645 [Dehalococcoidia bacterium]